MHEPIPVSQEYKQDKLMEFNLKLLRELGHNGAADWIEQTHKENQALTRGNERLKEALKPFSELLVEKYKNYDDDISVGVFVKHLRTANQFFPQPIAPQLQG